MIAYSNALLGTSTTMVLSPDSEFFRYFLSRDGRTAPAAPAVPPAAPQAGTATGAIPEPAPSETTGANP
jgi:membrane protease subunit HflC